MLFSWLLARQAGGDFLFRLEDTDRTRLVPESVQSMVEDFAWLGLDIDEGPTADDLTRGGYAWEGAKGFRPGAHPMVQSLRLDRYRDVADQLLARGFAYRCDCPPERLEAERAGQQARGEAPGYSGFCRDRNVPASRPHVVRFRIDAGTSVSFTDGIRGVITWDSVILKDTVILKTDGYPTYHLSATVDDHDSAISHVLRGEEWISTTPLHLLIYRALGWDVPVIGHLPVIVGSDGKKLSKRTGAAFCRTYREQGYLPDALLNYLLLNGWSPAAGDEQEILTREEMIAKFSLERVHASPATFSPDKLQWMNGVYMRHTPDATLARLIEPLVTAAGYTVDRERLRAIIPHVRERLTATLNDAVPLVEFLFVDVAPFGPAQAQDLKLQPADAAAILSVARDRLVALAAFDVPSIEQTLSTVPEAVGLSKKAVFMCLRVAATGRKVTPPLFECIAVLGRETTIARLDQALLALRAPAALQ